MKSLFSENRLANLLIVLRRSLSVSMDSLTTILNVSDRTIRNDIKQINEEMEDCAVIEFCQGKFNLRVYQETIFREKFSKMIQQDDFMNSAGNRQDYIFGKLMRAQEPVLTDELAYEMNVGRTTMVSDLKKLRSVLEEYKLSVIGMTSKGIVLNGAEIDIRRYVIENNFESVYRDYPMDQEILEVLKQVMEEQGYERKVRESLTAFTILMLDRFLTGHYIGTLTTQYYNLTSVPEYVPIDRMAEKFSAILHVNIPVEERLYIFLPIIGMRTPTDVSDMNKIALDETVRPLMQEILLRIKTDMNITIQSGEFTEEFLYHLMFMINRLKFRVKLRNPLLDDLKTKYPLACQMAEVAAGVISEFCGKEVSVEEKGYLASYFGVFLTNMENTRERQFSIAVVCGTGRVTARLVSAQLRKILDSNTELTLFSDEKVTSDILNQFDLVLTTVQLSCACNRPIIRINEIFNERELLQKIEKVRYWDEVDVPLIDNNWFLMTGLIDESRFFHLEGIKTYEEALNCMVDSLTVSGQLDAGFAERLRQREDKGTMVFDQAIAIPHSIQCAGEQIVLAIGVSDKPLVQNGNEIQLIILLGLPERVEENEELLLRVYDEIMTIATDEELRARIVASDTYPALLRSLYRNAGER